MEEKLIMKNDEIIDHNKENASNDDKNYIEGKNIRINEETGTLDGIVKKPKSQKAGLNAIRPDDYVEKTFKDLAKNSGKSQTELFEAMFWNYIKKEQDKEMEEVISFKSEINLISSDLENILKHFKNITEKAQSTIITERNNATQKLENLYKELETADLKNKELMERNKELEISNEAFTSIKENLTSELNKLEELLKSKDREITTIKKDMEESAAINSKYLTKIANLEAEIKEKELERKQLKDSLDKYLTAYQFETEKRTRLEDEINELKESIHDLKENFKEEKESLEKALQLKYDAEKNMAVVDIKLELIEVKNSLQEKLLTINKLNQIIEQKNNIILEIEKRSQKEN